MKRKWLGLALAAIASAGVAFATEYTDSSANYAEGWATGDNGGEGFGAWTIATTSGSDGWAGFGIWDPAANEFQGAWEGKTQAFGMIGKGGGFSVKASRAFRAALATGDSFQLDMGVNWDANIDGAHKGFVLTAGGKDILEINHGNYPGHIYINEDDSCDVWNEAPKPELGEVLYPMTWKFTAKDATTLTVSANSRKDASNIFEKDITVETSAIDGFRLQSVEQDNQNEDRRQSYYDNFVLDIAGELPELVTLGLLSDDWAVTSASQTLYYTLTRSSSAGALDVTISSSDESFVAGKTVSFEDGVEAVKFELEATLTGSGNFATITASATGCDPATYEVKGPAYLCNAHDDQWQLDVGATCPFYVNNWQSSWFPGDDSLIEVVSADESVVTVEPLADWATDAENPHTYASWTVTAVAGGKADVEVFYDGVKVGSWGFEVLAAGATLSGPTSLRTGATATYTADITLGSFEEGIFRLVADPDLVTIEPAEVRVTESGPVPFQVTAGEETGSVTLTLEDDDGIAGYPELTVTITEAPDYDKFIAYDEASLYEGSFDFSSTGAGKEGFGAWKAVQTNAEYGNVIVDGGDAGMPAILSDDGKALALYANGGENPVYSVVRPFVNTLQPGQKASVEFVASEASGSRVVRFVRIEESGIYNRFEIWNNSGAIGINIDGVETAINWPNGLRRVEASIEVAADGSSFTLELLGHNPDSDLLIDDIYTHVVNSDVGYWGGGIQGIFFEGSGSGENFVFNRLAIEQVKEPVPPAPPAVTMSWAAGVWNPDEVGVPYTFTLEPSEIGAVGPVELSIEPADGVELSADQIDLSEGAASFTLTFTGEELPAGTSYTITAKAQVEGVDDAIYGLTATEPSSELRTTSGEYTFDYTVGGTIEFQIVGTPSRAGQTVALDSGNEAILVPPSPAEVVVGAIGSDDGKFVYTMVGEAEGEVWVHATKDEAEWGYAGITINGKGGSEPRIDGATIEVSFADGDGLSGKVDDALMDQFTDVKAQVLQWNGEAKAFVEVEVLENEADPGWPNMKFTPSIDNPVIRLIFLK